MHWVLCVIFKLDLSKDHFYQINIAFKGKKKRKKKTTTT